MTRIFLSLFTIGVVMALATAATLAYFQGTTTFDNDPSVLSTTGDVSFVAVLTTNAGVPTPFTASLLPGTTVERCLWIRNTSSVPARFKVYMESESGDHELGNALRLDAQLTPDEGRCTDNPSQISGAGALFTNFNTAGWNDVLVRGGGFYTADTTPFKTATDGLPMGPNEYARLQFDLTLPEDAGSDLAGKSYTFQGQLFAVQDGGALDPTPTPSASPTASPTGTPEPTPTATPTATPTVEPSPSASVLDEL